MNRKEVSSVESCHTTGSGQEHNVQVPHQLQDGAQKLSGLPSSDYKLSEKCVYDSRLSDSGVWSGSNIQSEEIATPESPVSKSGDLSFTTDEIPSEKSYMRLDSGIDVGASVSQQFSGLSITDESCNNLNSESLLKTQGTTCSTNITEEHPEPSESSAQTKKFLEFFQQNEDGDTYLHLAIINKYIEVVYALVRMVPHPAYLNIHNDERQTPLHLAVLLGEARLARLLVCAGAALDVLDRYGNTPLHLAIQADSLACVRAIIDPVTTPETQAARLQYSPHPYPHKNIANIYNYEGLTCVHLAALNGNVEILRHLIWNGADINAREGKGGHTCLHIAVERKDLSLCVFLLGETKIDADEMSYAGHTAYQTAWGWHSGIAEALRSHGADTYVASDDDEDDDMLDLMESSFANSFPVNGSGLVNVGA